MIQVSHIHKDIKTQGNVLGVVMKRIFVYLREIKITALKNTQFQFKLKFVPPVTKCAIVQNLHWCSGLKYSMQ